MTLVTGRVDGAMPPLTKRWPVNLEDQGVPADVAAHRRSVAAKDQCEIVVQVERWDSKLGQRRDYPVKCQSPAVAINAAGLNCCPAHRS
jgi:hypothetical protein